MYQKNIAFYLGQEKQDGFTGYIAEGNLFLILEITEGMGVDQGREALRLVKDNLMSAEINKLSDLDLHISQSLKDANLPAGCSLAVSYLNNNIFLLKTIGSGEIYLHRGKETEKIISGDENASGLAEEKDTYIFTTNNFISILGGKAELGKIFDHRTPHQIVDELSPKLKSQDDSGTVSLFVQLNKVEDEPLIVSRVNPLDKVTGIFRSAYENVQLYSQKTGKKKTLTFVVIIIVFLIFIWSVGLGYTRRSEAKSQKKVEATRELIKQKLDQANEMAYLNLERAQVLTSEAKAEVEKLKKELNGKKQKEIAELEALVSQQENKITKKEEKTYEEFYDLSVDNKAAKGNKGYLQGATAVILDKAQGNAYILSLDKKSLEKKNFAELKKADLIAFYQDEILFYIKGGGIYKIGKDDKLKKAIENDSDWGNIQDIWLYNGNIYLLDSGKNEIWKYLVAEEGYSVKSSYFKENHPSLNDSNSLSIDSSLYIGFKDQGVKYTGGVKDEFSSSFPESDLNINKFFTTKDVEKVYAWDKKKGSIYVLGKNGTYEREINSSILKQADDLFVFGTNAYLLTGAKIYSVNLD
ncbi:MAG: hypothetical protein UR15_C0018G0006 [Parcubacteria group bacterium GW2011_GWA2_31_28]|nr:MAG: hypothetical protein UR15_C0018G0006 [Parcubacteria group bacterium GW2011_GWA2_31_28]